MKFLVVLSVFTTTIVYVYADDCCGCHTDAFIVKEKKKGDDTVIMQDSTGGKMIHTGDKRKNQIVWTEGGGECCPKIKHHVVKVPVHVPVHHEHHGHDDHGHEKHEKHGHESHGWESHPLGQWQHPMQMQDRASHYHQPQQFYQPQQFEASQYTHYHPMQGMQQDKFQEAQLHQVLPSMNMFRQQAHGRNQKRLHRQSFRAASQAPNHASLESYDYRVPIQEQNSDQPQSHPEESADNENQQDQGFEQRSSTSQIKSVAPKKSATKDVIDMSPGNDDDWFGSAMGQMEKGWDEGLWSDQGE